MPSLNRNEKFLVKFVVHKYKIYSCSSQQDCFGVTLYFTQCPKFSTTAKNVLNCRIAVKQSCPKLDVNFTWKICFQEFSRFYAIRQRKNAQYGFPIRTADTDPDKSSTNLMMRNLKEIFAHANVSS